MGLLPDVQNCGLCTRRECRECYPRHRQQRKPLLSDPGMHHGTCVTHVLWCMSGSLTRGSGDNVPGIPGACAFRNFANLVRGPWILMLMHMAPEDQIWIYTSLHYVKWLIEIGICITLANCEITCPSWHKILRILNYLNVITKCTGWPLAHDIIDIYAFWQFLSIVVWYNDYFRTLWIFHSLSGYGFFVF